MVPFHGDMIETVYDHRSNTIFVVCRRVAENLGLAWGAQFTVIQGHAVLSKYLLRFDIETEDLRTREMLCLPLKYVPLWLAGIQVRRVRPEIREKLLLYQEECADVLARYFLGDGVTVNPGEPVRSTLDIIEGMTKSQMLLIQEVRRTQRITDGHSHDITRLEETKLDKYEFERHLVQQSAKAAQRRWYMERRFPDWVKEWMWAHAGGRCLNPACRRQLNPSPQAPRVERPQYDHVRSIMDGGYGTIDNCQLLCTACNQQKRGLYVDHRPRDLKAAAETLAHERRETRAQEDEKRRRQQDFGF